MADAGHGEPHIVKINKYQIGPTLGEGTYGKVKKAYNISSGEYVAIKILDKASILKYRMANQLKLEISLMKKLHHENVLRIHEVLTSNSKIFIVLELARGGELFEKIATATRFDEDTTRYYFRQLVRGVECCHANGVCHRDLKPENLLLDEHNVLKISDFGLCANMEKDDILLKTQCGTPNYTAPEILLGKKYDGKPADVWSCGVILFVMLAGYLPFEEPSTTELVNKIKNADYTFPSFFPETPKSLIRQMLVVDPTKRLTLKQVKANDWYTHGMSPEEKEKELKDAKKQDLKISMKEVEAAFEQVKESEVQSKDGPAPSLPSSTTPPSGGASPSPKPKGKVATNIAPLTHTASAANTTFVTKVSEEATTKRVKEELAKLVQKKGGNFYPYVSSESEEANEGKIATAPPLSYTGAPEHADSNKIKVVFPARGGVLALKITIAQGEKVGETIVEVRRGKGNQIEFFTVYKQLRGVLNDISPWAVK